MSHAGYSSCPDNTSPDPKPVDAACGVYHRDAFIPSESGASQPIQAARADAALPKESLPFVVQAGLILYLVAEETDDWVLAELRFDPTSCTFAEERRNRFQWPREVFGRLLSRTIIGVNVDMSEANRVADAFERWLASQYVSGARTDRT